MRCFKDFQKKKLRNEYEFSLCRQERMNCSHTYLNGFMKTWLQLVSKGPMLSASLVPRL